MTLVLHCKQEARIWLLGRKDGWNCGVLHTKALRPWREFMRRAPFSWACRLIRCAKFWLLFVSEGIGWRDEGKLKINCASVREALVKKGEGGEIKSFSLFPFSFSTTLPYSFTFSSSTSSSFLFFLSFPLPYNLYLFLLLGRNFTLPNLSLLLSLGPIQVKSTFFPFRLLPYLLTPYQVYLLPCEG